MTGFGYNVLGFGARTGGHNPGFSPHLRTGNGSSQAITDVAFSPSMLLSKNRGASGGAYIVDTTRGAGQSIISSAVTAQSSTPSLTSFDAAGVTFQNDALNISTNTYVDYYFREGSAFGFDVVTYTGNSTAGRTVAHNLSAVPEMMWVKNLTTGISWRVYHSAKGATYFGELDSPNPFISDATGAYWRFTAPDAANFTLGSDAAVNGSGDSYVAYLFASVPGVIKLGNYMGNGSAAGPSVVTGLQCRLLMIKRAGDAGGWYVWDSVRNIINPRSTYFLLNDAIAEATSAAFAVDFNGSGFQIKTSSAEINASGETYAYMAIG